MSKSMEKNQQELFFKLSMFEQQIQNIQQQLQAVEKAILDLGSLSLDLEELKGSYIFFWNYKELNTHNITILTT